MIAALVIGFAGSLHCLGMCGPLMLTLMGPKQSAGSFIIYHSGRIGSYVVIGLILGLIGQSFRLFEVQQVVTIALGIALLLIYAVPGFRRRVERAYYESGIYQKVKTILSNNLSIRKRHLVSGIANGFLPCGLTYVAAAGAVALGTISDGAMFMFSFGLGTIPALAIIAFGGHLVGKKWTGILPGAITGIAIVAGVILLLRGMLMTFPDFQNMVQTHAAGLITVCGL